MKSLTLSSFCANKNVFSTILSEIRKKKDSIIPQPILIVGEDGAGKTTLLKRIRKEIKNKELIFIEGRYLFSTQDIIASYENLDSIHYILIDNWDYYLSRSSLDDQYRLRKILNSEGAPMMIATIRRLVPSLVKYDAPFFEGMDIIYCDSISDECFKSLFKNADINRAIKLWFFLPKTIKSAIIITEILTINDDPQKDLEYLIDRFFEKYQSLYNSLPQYSQIILNSLDNRMLLSDIRSKTNLPTSILTPYLANLKKNGIVNTSKKIKRKTEYYIKDPMLELWLRSS